MNSIEALSVVAHATPAFKAWLGRMLVDNPNGLGSELHEAVYDGTNRITADQGHAAGQLLRAVEALGWVERTMLAPSIDQQAFAGLTYGALSKTGDDTKAHHAEWFAFRVIDRDAVRKFVGHAMPKATTFELGDVVRYSPAFVAQVRGDARMRKARGRVVGFAEMGDRLFPRVSWSDDPTDEPACQDSHHEGPSCKAYDRKTGKCSAHRLQPYRARAVSPAAVRKA